jgi:hypothetical protein
VSFSEIRVEELDGVVEQAILSLGGTLRGVPDVELQGVVHDLARHDDALYQSVLGELRNVKATEERVVPLPVPASGPDPDLDDFLAGDESEDAWLIPGLIERSERLVVTGSEGVGKSTLLDQLTVQGGTGLHPFTLEPIEPIRVLRIDLESSTRQARRRLRPLRVQAGDRLQPDLVIPIVKPEGIDLLTDEDAEWLAERVRVNLPDLLVVGPVYKMLSGDATAEEPARQVVGVLDALRAEYELAIILEAHSPYGAGGARPRRPYGASLWSRWPEFGLHLSETGMLTHWRGPREERSWPPALERGGQWPWTAATASAEALWARIVEYVEAGGGERSMRRLAGALGASKSTVERVLSAHRSDWEELVG